MASVIPTIDLGQPTVGLCRYQFPQWCLTCVFGGLTWVQLIRARLHRLGDSWTLADLPQLLWLHTHARSTAGGNFPDHCDPDWQEEDREAKNKRGLTSSKYPPALLASKSWVDSCFICKPVRLELPRMPEDGSVTCPKKKTRP